MNLYSLTKLCNVYHAQSLNEYFKQNHKEIKSASLHPGVVNTDIFSSKRYSGTMFKCLLWVFHPLVWLLSKDAFMGAQTTLHVAYLQYDDLNSGAYFSDCKEERLGKLQSDIQKREEFMIYTHQLIKNNWKDLPLEINNYFT